MHVLANIKKTISNKTHENNLIYFEILIKKKSKTFYTCTTKRVFF